MLLVGSAPVALADGPATSLSQCSVKDTLNNKRNCFDLFKKECKRGENGVKNTKDCKRIAGGVILQPVGEGPSLGEKVCKGHSNVACDVTDGISEGSRDVNEAVGDPAGTLASAAFDAAAGKFGDGASKILSDLTDVFLDVSTVQLEKTGVLKVYSITWGLSALVALLLLIWQFTTVAYSGEGKAAATAIIGLAKWSLICVASLAVTQTALAASDQISDWIISQYKGESAFEDRLNNAFAFDPATNSALIMLLGILASLISLVLWGEMLLRQAAIVLLVGVMPIVAAGGIMQATKEWFPKARNALISMILMKPVIVLIFVTGFTTTGDSKSIKDFLVGLLTLVLAALCWPALAKFMTFTSVGSGGSLASGILGAAGGTAGSMFGYGGGMPSGAGAIGSGRAFTRAVEAENDSSVAQAGASGAARRGSGGLGKLGGAAMALQVAKAGKEMAEGSMESMAAHADLGPGKDMGGHVYLPRTRGESSGAPLPRAQEQTPPPAGDPRGGTPPVPPRAPQQDGDGT